MCRKSMFRRLAHNLLDQIGGTGRTQGTTDLSERLLTHRRAVCRQSAPSNPNTIEHRASAHLCRLQSMAENNGVEMPCMMRAIARGVTSRFAATSTSR